MEKLAVYLLIISYVNGIYTGYLQFGKNESHTGLAP
jgi:hypothetical protein